ncbi:MAG: pentapeptide repeat-containing protein [Nitrospirales bacterium]|nr:pentapeptide repeat-containing protein [Nitrospirales bacterium]
MMRGLPVVLVVLLLLPGPVAWASCQVEREIAGEPGLFVRHFSPDCSKPERAAQAVQAAEVLQALKAGMGVSIRNAVVSGDLLLTQLPAVPVASVTLPDSVRAGLAQSRVMEVRVIRGLFSIRDSVVDGILDTQLKPDMVEHRILGDRVVIQGPVAFRGTTFTKTVDLSRTIFLGPVESDQAVFLGEALFLSCIFDQKATFEKTAFAGNTRYYQTVFHEPVTFLRAGFNGLTNFLSVTFRKESSFSRAYFKLGTGFSGSTFEGISDFSEALFEKNAFFSHAVFAADTYFRRAVFRGEVNFSDADFKAKDDFAKVFYQQEPNFTRARFANPRSSVGFENPVLLAIVAGALAVFLIAFIVILKKS